MGRRATGWRLRWHESTKTWQVRFTHEGKRYERSTTTRVKRHKGLAAEEAARIYAEIVTGQKERQRPAAAAASSNLLEWVTAWLDDLTVRPETRATHRKRTVRWLRQWRSLSDLSDESLAAYARARLREVQAKTVRNELSALRGFLSWLVHDAGALRRLPRVPIIASSSKRGESAETIVSTGTCYRQRRRTRAPELTPAEVRAVIARLEQRSRRDGWPIRDRFILMYETTLRPETLDKLRVPTHYTRGSDLVILTDADDKEAYGREIPLTPRAQRALERVCPDVGLVFGAHRYDEYIHEAASAALPPHKARVFCGQHFRSAAITHWLERPEGNLPAVQHMAGHKHTSTTAKYIRPSLRAALAMVKKRR